MNNTSDHDVFRAIADESRRILLDALFERDGQTLVELCAHLPTMTRFGVMKHLQILDEAGVITSRKVGREKYHYLNPVPIQEIYDRWVSKFARHWSQHLTALKYALETPTMKPAHVMQIFIQTTPEKLWQALTDGEFTKQYYFTCAIESTWQVGAPYTMVDIEGNVALMGTVLEIDPPRRLVTTFRSKWQEDDAPDTTVIYEIEQVGTACKLTLTHQDLIPGNALHESFKGGWAQILSGLKTLLETGQPLILNS